MAFTSSLARSVMSPLIGSGLNLGPPAKARMKGEKKEVCTYLVTLLHSNFIISHFPFTECKAAETK